METLSYYVEHATTTDEKLAILTGLKNSGYINETVLGHIAYLSEDEDKKIAIDKVLWSIPGGAGMSTDLAYNVAKACITASDVTTATTAYMTQFKGTKYAYGYQAPATSEGQATTQYTITWNIEGTKTTSKVNSGVVPVYSGTPTKTATTENSYTYTYNFSVWNPTPVAATEDAEYVATFSYTATQNS